MYLSNSPVHKDHSGLNFRARQYLLLFIIHLGCVACYGQQKSIHCLGNGEMCVYQEKADIVQLFGPPYSSPSVLQLFLTDNQDVISEREKGTAIWTHHLRKNGSETAQMVDFVSATTPAFIRTIQNTDTISFLLKLPEETQWLDQTLAYPSSAADIVLLTSPAGTYAYQNIFYPTSVANNYHLILNGNIKIVVHDDHTWMIHCLPGKSGIVVVSGYDYPQCVLNTEKILLQDTGKLLAETRNEWLKFTSSRIDFEELIPAGIPERNKLLKAIDDVAVLLKVQQAKEGAVIAGYNYHMGYIRDQYGVSRGLLKMGHVAEAKAILRFYWDVWKRNGILRNAQGVGLDAFHVHENDDVEITGYLIIQVFDYLKATGDDAFIKEIFPMLDWAWECQVRNLFKNMLPFNGDETYIAGGILPRTVMFDGSAEATLLFITGGEHLISWAGKNELWDKQLFTRNKAILGDVKSDYPRNFLAEVKVLTNNPERKKGLNLPRFRHGVCESCYQLEWTQKTTSNRYLCPVCFPDKSLPEIIDECFYLQSVSLMPWYVHSTLIPDTTITLMIGEIIDLYTSTGKFPSRPEGNRTVGYDYGLFLYSLTQMNHPLKDRVYKQMLDVIDDSGAWVEYYDDSIPSGNLCRPWESGVNIEAAIEYAKHFNKK